MTINLIANVIYYKNKLVIGCGNDLIVKLNSDMKFFKTITQEISFSKFAEEIILKNVVVMGKKTWDSIPDKYKPLSNRINIVLTRNKNLHNFSYKKINQLDVIYTDFKQFIKFYKKYNPNVYVIGGSEIYNLFLQSTDKLILPKRCWLTQVYDYPIIKLKEMEKENKLITIEPLNNCYNLVGISENFYDTKSNLNFRILHYKLNNLQEKNGEIIYLDLLNIILKSGKNRIDRTGVGTISSFGHQMRFDISQTVPLLTTKTVPWKQVIEELLWFMRGDTDAGILQNRGIKIWDGNSSRDFLDSRGLKHYPEGTLGPVYGFQWRFFGAHYHSSFADTSKIENPENTIGGFDQLEYIIDLLKNDPFSRRIILSGWNPNELNNMALPPCHLLCQFYVEEINGLKYLSCQMYQRSQDEFLGCPFNIFSYTVLTYILAKRCDLKPKDLIISVGDAHIYTNHIDQVKQQLSRTPRSLPKLILDDSLKNKQIKDITIDDFKLFGYFPNPIIRANMAI